MHNSMRALGRKLVLPCYQISGLVRAVNEADRDAAGYLLREEVFFAIASLVFCNVTVKRTSSLTSGSSFSVVWLIVRRGCFGAGVCVTVGAGVVITGIGAGVVGAGVVGAGVVGAGVVGAGVVGACVRYSAVTHASPVFPEVSVALADIVFEPAESVTCLFHEAVPDAGFQLPELTLTSTLPRAILSEALPLTVMVFVVKV